MGTRSVVSERRTEKLDLRVSLAAKVKLQAAAAAAHRSMSDFVMESALSKADEMLAERRIFSLDSERWAAFQSALDAPVSAMPRMEALLQKPGFFDGNSEK